MTQVLNRLWRSSPASLAQAIRRRLPHRDGKPGWFKIRGGPGAGAELYLPNAHEGGWLKMVEGTFDDFLYSALQTRGGLQGKVCWDVGAHIGYHSLCFSALGAQVLAFEPNPANAERLRLHLEKNPTLGARVRHVPKALSDCDGRISFVQCTDLATGSSGSHLAAALPPSSQEVYQDFEKTEVAAERADAMIQHGEVPPDIIKIDVEGAEYLVLKGAVDLLSRQKPQLFIEVHHICLMMQIQKLLQGLGYDTRLLDEPEAAPSRCFIMASAVRG
jgi:FkbM family methyltransferase